MLSATNISIQFGHKKIFDETSFIINKRDRTGLVGSNGSGKTTLLKIICGLLKPDKGLISLSKHTTVGYLPQDGISYKGKSIYDEVYTSISDIASLKKEIEDVQTELSNHKDKKSPEYSELVEKLGELQHRFEDIDGFRIKSTIEKVLSGLGFSDQDFNRLTDVFSGGWQMRVALSKLLLKNPSILLLDEPTNFLDIESLLWLENFLKSYDGAIIIVSHDRKFLDNLTNKTIEICSGKVTVYYGNYSYYESEKAIRTSILEKKFINQQKYMKEQLRFVERFRYKASKASVVQSRIKMLEKMEMVEIENAESKIKFKFPPATRSGKQVIELKNLSKSYGDKFVLNNINLEIERGDKIGLVGANGEGKSTLARIILAEEEYQSGTRKIGHNVEIEFYSEHQAEVLDSNLNVLETLDAVADGEIRKYLRNILGCFLFQNDDVYKPVSVLSGGEKSRLALARMLIKGSNFLILDEPTNHLDMNSKRILMNALKSYESTVLVISHDREFLDGFVNKVIEIKNKNIKIYHGNCTYYLEKKNYEELNFDNKSKIMDDNNTFKKTKGQKRLEAEQRNNLYNITKPIRNKINDIEEKIRKQETGLTDIEKIMTSENFYCDTNNVIETNIKFKQFKAELELLYNEWLENNDKLNQISLQFSNKVRQK